MRPARSVEVVGEEGDEERGGRRGERGRAAAGGWPGGATSGGAGGGACGLGQRLGGFRGGPACGGRGLGGGQHGGGQGGGDERGEEDPLHLHLSWSGWGGAAWRVELGSRAVGGRRRLWVWLRSSGRCGLACSSSSRSIDGEGLLVSWLSYWKLVALGCFCGVGRRGRRGVL